MTEHSRTLIIDKFLSVKKQSLQSYHWQFLQYITMNHKYGIGGWCSAKCRQWFGIRFLECCCDVVKYMHGHLCIKSLFHLPSIIFLHISFIFIIHWSIDYYICKLFAELFSDRLPCWTVYHEQILTKHEKYMKQEMSSLHPIIGAFISKYSSSMVQISYK